MENSNMIEERIIALEVTARGVHGRVDYLWDVMTQTVETCGTLDSRDVMERIERVLSSQLGDFLESYLEQIENSRYFNSEEFDLALHNLLYSN